MLKCLFFDTIKTQEKKSIGVNELLFNLTPSLHKIFFTLNEHKKVLKGCVITMKNVSLLPGFGARVR